MGISAVISACVDAPLSSPCAAPGTPAGPAPIPDPGHGPTSGPAATEITVIDTGGGLPDVPEHEGQAWSYFLDGVAHATRVEIVANQEHLITFPPGTSGNSLYAEDANRSNIWTSPVASPAFTEV